MKKHKLSFSAVFVGVVVALFATTIQAEDEPKADKSGTNPVNFSGEMMVLGLKRLFTPQGVVGIRPWRSVPGFNDQQFEHGVQTIIGAQAHGRKRGLAR